MANPNAKGKKGNKGGGRRTLRDERTYVKMLESIVFDPVDLHELSIKINKSIDKDHQGFKVKVTGVDILRHKFYTEPSVMNKILDKLIPSKAFVPSEGAGDVMLIFKSANGNQS